MSFITNIKTDFKKIVVTSVWLVFSVISFSALPAYADVCGDGNVEALEQCDDSNIQSSDGCSDICVIEANWNCGGSPSFCEFTSPCAAGNYWNGSVCTEATAGHYVPDAGAIEQIACATGSYQPNTASTSCNPADAGHYVGGTAAIAQSECITGTYQPNTGSASCNQADAGYYVSGTAAITQTNCTPGNYQPNMGSTSCIPADAGYYVSASAAISQMMCLAGTNSAAGAVSCYAAPASVPNMFVSGQAASASEVNANFNALVSQINQLQVQLAALQPRPAALAIIGTYDFVDFNAKIDAETTYLVLSHTAGGGTFTFAAGGVITGSSTWAGSNLNLNNMIMGGGSLPATSLISMTTIPDSGTDVLSGTYTIAGSTVSIDIGEGTVQGIVSPDGKMIVMQLHGSDHGVLIGIKR